MQMGLVENSVIAEKRYMTTTLMTTIDEDDEDDDDDGNNKWSTHLRHEFKFLCTKTVTSRQTI